MSYYDATVPLSEADRAQCTDVSAMQERVILDTSRKSPGTPIYQESLQAAIWDSDVHKSGEEWWMYCTGYLLISRK